MAPQSQLSFLTPGLAALAVVGLWDTLGRDIDAADRTGRVKIAPAHVGIVTPRHRLGPRFGGLIFGNRRDNQSFLENRRDNHSSCNRRVTVFRL